MRTRIVVNYFWVGRRGVVIDRGAGLVWPWLILKLTIYSIWGQIERQGQFPWRQGSRRLASSLLGLHPLALGLSSIISDALLLCGHFLGSIRAAAGYASNDNWLQIPHLDTPLLVLDHIPGWGDVSAITAGWWAWGLLLLPGLAT